MAIILEAVGASGDVQTLPLSGAATRVQALPGLQYRLRDSEGGRIADGAKVKRVGDDLVVEGLPGDASVSLEGFFTRCAPGDACSLSMENIGGSAGEAILPSTQPVAAFSDGSFLMYASGATAPQLPTAPEAETSYKPALGALAGLAVVGGGGGGGDTSSDTTAPPAPVITSGEFTNKTKPVIAGTAEAGATVTITLDAGSDGTSDVSYAVQADANGAWTVDTATATPTFGALPALAEGVPTEIRALARDAAGNASPTTIASLILDTIAPGQPTITSALLTNDATPVIRGAADPGSIVTVGLDLDRNGSVDVSWRTVAGSLGTYLVDVGSAPASGTLPGGALGDVSTTNLVVVASDLAGNASAPATAVLNVDTRLPDPPVIGTIAGDNAINATEAAGSITISGTISEPDRPVTFQWGGLTETFTSTGTTWSVTVPSGSIPADGLQTVIVTYVGAAGSTSIEGRQDVLVDRVVPDAPSLSLVSASDTGTAGDGITSDDTPTLRIDLAGTGAQAGDTVSLFSAASAVGGALLDDADVAAGYVEVTAAALGADGVKSLTATITDAAVNVSPASAALPLTIDRTAPTVAITDNVGGTATGPVTFTFTFSEPVLGFTADDVAVTGGTKGAFAQTGAATYTLVVTPPTDTNGQISVSVPAGAATDVAGTPSTASAVVVQDFALALPPTVAITDNAGATTNAPVTFTFTFSEPVTGFTADEIAVVNGTKGAFAQTGATTYTLVVTPPSGSVGTMTVTVPAGAATDLAGNASVGPVSATQAYDTALPTLAITDSVEGIASGSVLFTFTFSEPVSGFASGDIDVTGGAKGTFTALSATTYSLVVIPEADTAGTITVSVAAGAATDPAGNPNTAASVTQDFDTTVPPTLTISDNVAGIANSSVIFEFSFTEPVTGFASGDIAVTNGDKGAFTVVDPSTYTLVVTPTGTTGTITVEVPAGAANDLAGNPSDGPVSATQDFDTLAPTLTISNDATGVVTGDVLFTFTFNEPVFGFVAADVQVANGSKGAFAGANGASVYTLVVTPDAGEQGTLVASVNVGAGADAAGNPTPASSSTVSFDTAAPTIDITQIVDDVGGVTVIPSGGTTDDLTPTLTLSFSELLAVDILRNGTVIETLAPGTTVYEDTLPAIEGASYTYTARMTDAAGNVGTSALYTIIFETAISG